VQACISRVLTTTLWIFRFDKSKVRDKDSNVQKVKLRQTHKEMATQKGKISPWNSPEHSKAPAASLTASAPHPWIKMSKAVPAISRSKGTFKILKLKIRTVGSMTILNRIQISKLFWMMTLGCGRVRHPVKPVCSRHTSICSNASSVSAF
jgi:hypothetical protein